MINTEDYSGMDLTYSQIVPQPYPAREAVFVTALPKDARVEISVIAKTRS
jgi:enamine deaminase RidA (YjgF/YER057c/UK114 family)